MKKGCKIALITGGSLFGLGIVCIIIGAGINGFDLSKLSSGKIEYEKKTLEYTDSFSAIDIHSISDDVKLVKSEDGKTRIEYYDSKDGRIRYDIQRKYASADEKGKPELFAKQKDDRKWYEYLLSFDFDSFNDDRAVTVYVPGEEYDSLSLESVSGDVSAEIPLRIKNNVTLNSTSGNINAENQTAGVRSVYTSISGNVRIQNSASGDINASAVSGKVSLGKCTAKNGVIVGSISGNVNLEDIRSELTKTETVSGGVQVQKVDSKNIRIKTISGDISGSIGFGGTYDIRTVSGDVEHPSSVTNAGNFILETTSGDITLK